MILAGDIGGTKTNLALYEWTSGRVEPVREDSFHSADYKALEDIIDEFLSTPLVKPAPEPALAEDSIDPDSDVTPEAVEVAPEPISLTAACFGVAGPVIDNRCRTTNLPWFIDGAALAERFAIPHVRLLNDLEATAHGLAERGTCDLGRIGKWGALRPFDGHGHRTDAHLLPRRASPG